MDIGSICFFDLERFWIRVFPFGQSIWTPEGCMEADHQQDPYNTLDSLKASMSANSATLEDFRVPKVFWWVLLMVHTQSPKKKEQF